MFASILASFDTHAAYEKLFPGPKQIAWDRRPLAVFCSQRSFSGPKLPSPIRHDLWVLAPRSAGSPSTHFLKLLLRGTFSASARTGAVPSIEITSRPRPRKLEDGREQVVFAPRSCTTVRPVFYVFSLPRIRLDEGKDFFELTLQSQQFLDRFAHALLFGYEEIFPSLLSDTVSVRHARSS